MTRIFQTQSEIIIAAAPDAIFDAATDPCLWRHTYPACVAVERGTAGPARVNDTFTEVVAVERDTIRVGWRVDTCRRPTRWIISSRTVIAPPIADFAATMTVSYCVAPAESGAPRLRRSMLTAVATDGRIPRALTDLFGETACHDAHLAEIKRRLERA
ncbi:SRPBCC family protein [Nocardia terpenica]|uniref:SRPBCC family protein n=1 Tax=Nocardia terpenica TaxID=455432 RepID=A0A164KUP9_9NOCA|nr:SRPBCC family protein [Nocardia terpenica]ATL70085.1 hypothetical protein CRH09_31755 [Nocardia terpenica]KZM71726.1 hypothetical protein AWN90_03160 [Nocardia terpenica]MBF6063370.1 SRPBCC family protein [Nocardia terpenica]MBF6105926.1 SRPBCC family protein [Nocardia terpenica]MBF6113490.1 SRPBCC family protein [Nocardia terpenica]